MPEGTVDMYCGAVTDALSVYELVSKDVERCEEFDPYGGAVDIASKDVSDDMKPCGERLSEDIKVLRDNSSTNCFVLCGPGDVEECEYEVRDEPDDVGRRGGGGDLGDKLRGEEGPRGSDELGLVKGWADLTRLGDDELPDNCMSTTLGERVGTQEVGILKQSGIHTDNTTNCDLADSAVARTGSRASYES